MTPGSGEGFEWAEAPWGQALRCRAFGATPHGWTTRQLQRRGSPEVERDGWAAIGQAVGLTADAVVRLSQVHGADVHVATSIPCGTPQADIVISDATDRVVAVQVADCAPILTTSRSGHVVAASHAGWRGTAADVAGATVRAVFDRYHSLPDTLLAAIGPCIGPCCYEVGGELLQAFQVKGWTEADCARWFVRRGGRWFLDIWRANADQLAGAGVPVGQIFVSGVCTACQPAWFNSYRREGAGTGRQAGFIRPGRA